MEYQRFDPSPHHFPRPQFPMLPTLGTSAFFQRTQRDAPKFRVLETGPHAAFYTRARYALLEACHRTGVGPEGALLAPAYHCRTMIDPAIHLGAPVLLYAITAQFQPCLDSLKRCIAQSPQPVKALLLPHYFGFAQSAPVLSAVMALCASHGVALIEDCSHLLVTGLPAGAEFAPLGRVGHWTIASPYKLLACHEGGLLWSTSPEQAAAVGLQAAPWREVRTLLRALRAGFRGARAPSGRNDNGFRAATSSVLPGDCDRTLLDPQVSPAFQSAEARLRGAPWARWLMRCSSPAGLAERRRRHYERLLETAASLPNCEAVFDMLPADTVPYVFPLYLCHPDPHFFELKRMGLPLGRWDDLAVSDCPVAADYRLRLVHLPCHQMLTEAQVDWMCDALRVVLTQPASRS